MWETLLGGLLAILGGWAAIWYQSRNARKQRMDEITAERKIAVNAQAYSHMKKVQSYLTRSDTATTLNIILDQEQWFFDSRLFLPGRFPEKWLSVRNDLHKLRQSESTSSSAPEELVALRGQIGSTVSDAIDEIYKDMGLKRIELIETR